MKARRPVKQPRKLLRPKKPKQQSRTGSSSSINRSWNRGSRSRSGGSSRFDFIFNPTTGMVMQRLRCPIVQPSSLARWYLLQRWYFDLVTTRCNVEDAAAWIPWTGWRGWSVDAACQRPIRRSDTWNVMHLLASTLNLFPCSPNLCEDVKRKPCCCVHGFKTPNHNLMAHLWIDLDSFAREMIAAFLIGRYFHVCFHAHFAPAWGVSMEPAGWVLWLALNCRMIFSTKHCLFIFSNWSMGISEAYRFGKAHCSDLCRQNQCMKVVEQTGNKGLHIDVDWPSNTHVDSVYHALDSWESRLIMSEHWAVKQLYRFHSILVAVLHRQVAWVLIHKQHDFDSWAVCVAYFSIFFHLIC